jgi:hypothetical protein
MNKMSKQKKTQLILVGLLTLIFIGGLWYTIIRRQQENLHKLQAERKTAQDKASEIQDTIRNSAKIEAELLAVSNKLALKEEDMASGDLYISMFNLIRTFKGPYNVDIPQFSSVGPPAEMNLLPKFPYKQVSMTISGTATFFDFGRFAADFENAFPYARLVNLELEPASATKQDEKEKLSFRVDVVSLVKPEKSRPSTTR